MTEKKIILESENLLELYGVNNSKLDLVKCFYPKLKIIARDNVIKLIGTNDDIKNFETQLTLIIAYLNKYNSLSMENLRDLLNDGKSSGYTPNDTDREGVLVYGHNGKTIKARTSNQRKLVKLEQENDLLFAIGPAGSGKTYTAVALAVKALKEKRVKKIILCRPAVEAEESLGFLPGDMREKLNPYLQPLYDALQDMIHPKKLEEMFEYGIIQIAPLAYMRGRTLDEAFVILDEAQNATLNQLKMFLTRMGENAKFIVTGDLTQIDLPNKSKSGLATVYNMLKNNKNIGAISFQAMDIIRHTLVKDIISAFDKHTAEKNTSKQ